MFMLLSVVAVSSNAQPKQDKSKPDGKARKLVEAGNLLYNKKDFRSAINKYAEAIMISPNYPEAHFWKGGAYYYLNEFEPAAEELDKAFNQGYSPDKIYKLRWDVNYQIKNYDAALSDAQNAFKKDPRDALILLGIANIYRAKGENEKAIENYQKVLEADPKNANVYYFMAESFSSLGNTAKQEALAAEAVKRNTNYIAESYFLLGDAAQKLKKPDEAILAYEKLLNVKPEQPAATYLALSDAYRSQSRLSDSIKTAQKGTALYPEDGSLFVALTWYYSLANLPNKAVTAGQQAVKYASEKDKALANTNLCRAYNDAGSYQKAIAACTTALNLKPNDGETNYNLGWAYESQNNNLAVSYYKKAVTGLLEDAQADPEDPDVFYLLGNAYFVVENPKVDNAIKAYKQALQINPNFAKARLNLGNMYVKSNDLAAAREQYDILLKIDANAAAKLKQKIDNK